MEDRKGRAWVATSASCMYEHTGGVMTGVTVWHSRYISNVSLDELISATIYIVLFLSISILYSRFMRAVFKTMNGADV